jgi:hypothetical protein
MNFRYVLTDKGRNKDFKECFFTFFPSEIAIINSLKDKPNSIRGLWIELKKKNQTEGHNSYEYIQHKVYYLIKTGYIKRWN